MVVSAVLAQFVLRDHPDVTLQNKALMTLGAALLSGLLGYILLKEDLDKVDPKPPEETKK